MNYTFEKRTDGDYQVRLKGEFIMIAQNKNPESIDRRLKELGFNTREECFKFLVAHSLTLLNTPSVRRML